MGASHKHSKYEVKNERYCIGAMCRGEKKFMAIGNQRLCKACRDYANRVNNPEVAFGNPGGRKIKTI